MSGTPVLSYKKPSTQKDVKATAAYTTISSMPKDAGTMSPNVGVANASGTRKVSSRRKALQEFYHIQQQRKQQEQAQVQEQEQKVPVEAEVDPINLEDPVRFQEYVKTTPIQDILKLRNSIGSELNSHNSEKKSIIYDNYYELIKLNQTLQKLSTPVVPAKDDNGEAFTGLKDLDETGPKIDEHYILSSLNDLKDFLDTKANVYNDSFVNVITNLQAKYQTPDSESVSSVRGVINDGEDVVVFPESVEKLDLVNEINLVLSSSSTGEIAPKIDAIMSKLDANKDELLILQLNDVKKSALQ